LKKNQKGQKMIRVLVDIFVLVSGSFCLGVGFHSSLIGFGFFLVGWGVKAWTKN